MEYQRASAATAFSKKLSNGHSFNGKNMYDGVFGGQTKVGSRVEDYAEIFGGGSASSIPVLDVPELKERKFSVDVSSSKLEYSNIFGGFGDFDFAVSHEEFIAKPTRDKKKPAKTRSNSEDPLSIPVGNQVLSNDQTSQESGNGVKKFKMSFNESGPGSKNGTNGTTHVAQLHAVPGYTCLIDERITPSRNKTVPSVVNEPQRVKEDTQCKKPVSNVGKQTWKGVDELHSESRSNGYDFNDVFFGSSDVGQKTPPSKMRRASTMLNNMGANKHDFSKFGVPRSYSLDGDAAVSSPPDFDDEVDANSVAATSAAAVKKAIEEAQARLKIAKEMMERRKEGHIGRVKPSFNGSSKAKDRKKGEDTVKENDFSQVKAQETCEKIDALVQNSAGVGMQNVMKVCQMAAASEEREKSFIAGEAAEGTCVKNFIASQADCTRQEEVEKREAAKEVEREKDVMRALNNHEGEEMKIIEKPEKCGQKSEGVADATAQEYERKLKASKELCDEEECLHKLKPDVEFHGQKEETEVRFSEQWEEAEEKVCIELEACERKLEDPEKPTEDERKVEMQELNDTDNLERLTVAQEWVDMVERYKDMLKQEENGSALRDVFEKEENEMLLQDISMQKEFEKKYEEASEISELKREHEEACGPEENNEEEDACNREDNEQISDKMEKPEIIDLIHNGFDNDEESRRRLEENSDSLGNEEFMEAEENADLFEDAYQIEAVDCNREDNEQISDKMEKPEIIDLIHNGFDNDEESRRRLEENSDSLGNEEFMEAEENADLFEDAYQIEAVDCNREDNEQISDKVEKPEMIYLIHNGFDKEEEREMRVAENSDSLGNEEFMEAEENADLFKDAYQIEAVDCNGEDNQQISDKVEKPEIIDLIHNGFDKEEEREMRVEENSDSLGNEEFMEAEENADLFKDAYQIEAVDCNGEDNQQISDKVEKPEIIDLIHNGFDKEEEREMRVEENSDSLGNEEFMEAEENADLFKDAYQIEAVDCNGEDNQQISDKVEKPEIIDLIHNGFDKEEERKMRVEENSDSLGNEVFMEAEENADLFKDAYRMEAVEEGQKEATERLGTEEMQKQNDQKADVTTEAREDAVECCWEDLQAVNDAYDNEINNLGETLDPSINEDSSEMTPKLLVNEENGGIAEASKAYNECKETRRDSEAVEVDNDLEEKLAFDETDLVESNLGLDGNEQQMENEKEAFDFYRHDIDIDTADVTFEQNQYEQHFEESEIICNMEKHVEELACESEEDVKQAEFGLKQEENKYNFEISDEGSLVDSQLQCKFEEKHETTQIAHEIETSQSTEYDKESHLETMMKEDRGTNISSEEEVELVKEQQRRVDEAKEREREREKERKVVERAIREARERAFAEARERAAAGRTNVEARRKVKAEARGESAKPFAEANDKTFMEAKLKAERAAVERATAEARQRALEKALSEKASIGARNQAEKLSDARQSFQSYDSRYKGPCPPATSRNPNSTNQSASNSSEALDGATGESAERCKARLERHQRTAERAAKALEEKNKRDLLAQKEQAERNRLAETLDAEVKRWSSGKQGNLRALLSTLQYILGPDSGWQPIPLTDIIAAAAVKKAYRKATLCVHPDKLQQRGASIQQKYICEKVFDLLKEAWNKFSAEEQ